MSRSDDKENQTENSLARFSEVNRATAERVAQRPRAKGRKPAAGHNYVDNLERADRLLEGKGFEDATLEDWTPVLVTCRRNHATSTTHQLVVVIRGVLTQLYGDELLDELDDVLAVEKAGIGDNAVILDERDLHDLLHAAAEKLQAGATYPRTEVNQAILWALWDCGIRGSGPLSCCPRTWEACVWTLTVGPSWS